MQLRLYQPEDFAALYAIEEQCFEPPFRFSLRTMRELLAAQSARAWIAESDGAMAGFAILEVTHGPELAHAYIDTLEVAPRFRMQGLGAALLMQCERTALGANAAVLWLHVAAENDAAIRLYEAHGFEQLATEKNFYARGRHAHVYSKALHSVP